MFESLSLRQIPKNPPCVVFLVFDDRTDPKDNPVVRQTATIRAV